MAVLPSRLLSAEPPGARSPQQAFEGFIDAFNHLDWESFRAYLSDDISVFNPDIPGMTSLHRLDRRASVEDAFRGVFKSSAPGGPHIVPEHVQIQQFDETAIVTFEFKRSEQSFGRRTLVLHQQQGAWRIVHIHASNVDAPP